MSFYGEWRAGNLTRQQYAMEMEQEARELEDQEEYEDEEDEET